MITRRTALKTLAAAASVVTLPNLHAQQPASAGSENEGVFKLPPLGYDYDALEPFIDAETMKLHHNKHHAGYVSKLNQAIAKAPGLEKKSIEEILSDLNAIPEEVRTEIRNNGGGHANHALFWKTLRKAENGSPEGPLLESINHTFGSFEEFREKFSALAAGVFGSGWAWLVVREGKLGLESTSNQDSPLSTGAKPLLGIDVWEHAYYLKYQNRRAEYVKAFFNVIDWPAVADRLPQVG